MDPTSGTFAVSSLCKTMTSFLLSFIPTGIFLQTFFFVFSFFVFCFVFLFFFVFLVFFVFFFFFSQDKEKAAFRCFESSVAHCVKCKKCEADIYSIQ